MGMTPSDPARTIDMSTVTPSKTHTPPPCIQPHQPGERGSSPSSMYIWGIIMSKFVMETSGRPPSSLTKDCLKQQSCSLVSVTPWQPSSNSWMNHSRIWSLKDWLVVYMDDLLISSPSHNLDTERTKWVLCRMKELKLHLKIKKCKFGVSQINYLGMILSHGNITMDPVSSSIM